MLGIQRMQYMDLYCIDYLHQGAPRTWYAIPPSGKKRFEEFAAEAIPDRFEKCKAYLRHKTCLFSPTLLRERGDSCNKVIKAVASLIGASLPLFSLTPITFFIFLFGCFLYLSGS